MQRAVDPARGVTVVAHVELESDAAADRDEAMENLVVANQPRREHGDSGKSSGKHWSAPRHSAAVKTVKGPQAKKAQNSERNRLGQRRHAAQRPERKPVAP